ncbi:disrupted in renal carcinoma protein 2-like [Aphis craccivora]|uniref:Disrupted in renal carcinoma protein 2-like n=1 Tax=Aphis craccivora TaxID=307492 RepID=A0A6G0XT28_APHCR|nr:disrupted in renal carcinoma protein 2-like [Aphis craccivora]
MLQTYQSICLKLITSSPWYFTNKNLYKDLKIPTLNELPKLYYFKFKFLSNLKSYSLTVIY